MKLRPPEPPQLDTPEPPALMKTNDYDKYIGIGLMTNLLPVIPHDAVQSSLSGISPEQWSKSTGKLPGQYYSDTDTWSGMYQWNKKETTQENIDMWSNFPPHNIGMRTSGHLGVDIDVEDPELANGITSVVSLTLGDTLIRSRDNSPRTVLLYTLPESLKKSVLQLPDNQGKIEFLSDGQQVVLEGIHPSGGIQTTKGTPKKITIEAVNILIETLTEIFNCVPSTISSNIMPVTGEDYIDESDFNLARVVTYLQTCKPAIEGNSGDKQTIDTIFMVRDFGLSEAVTLEMVTKHYNPRCEPQWKQKDLAYKVSHAYRTAQNCIGSKGYRFGNSPLPEGCSATPLPSKFPQEKIDTSQDDIAINIGKRDFYQNARYIADHNKWLFWDGTRWCMDNKKTHYSRIGQSIREIVSEMQSDLTIQKNILNEDDFKKLQRYINSECKYLKSASYRYGISTLLKTDYKCSISHDVFDMDNYTIGTPNGLVSLKTGLIKSPERSDYISKLTGCSVAEGVPDLWSHFLKTIFHNDMTMIDFIQRLCGYCLTGLTVEEKIFFFYGTGANGKSKFLETLFFILGDYARKAPANLFLETRNQEHATGLAGLKGSRLVIGSELPSGAVWDEQTIKDITGGDTVTARLMRQDFFEFKPQFTTLIAGNHEPRLKNVDESMIRRMVIIPFKVTIPDEQKDEKLGDKLKAESGQILNWCIQGAVQYFQQGLNIPSSVTTASRDYIKNEDVIAEFIEDSLRAYSGDTEFSFVYKLYRSWMETQGHNFPLVERRLRKEFKDKKYNVHRSNSIWKVVL